MLQTIAPSKIILSFSLVKIKIELAPAHDVAVDGFLELMKKRIKGR